MRNFHIKPALVLALLLAAFTLAAQPQCDKPEKKKEFWEKAKAEKLEFITKRLNLTKAEKKAFLPVYNGNEERRDELFHARHEAFRALKKALKFENKSELETLLKNYVDAEAAVEKWEASYYERFSKVLSVEQLAVLTVAEEDFRQAQIHRLNDGRRQGAKPGDAPGSAPGGQKPGSGTPPDGNGWPPFDGGGFGGR